MLIRRTRSDRGPSPTASSDPNTDAGLLAWQVGARFNFPNNIYFQLAPTLYNYTGNGDTFNILSRAASRS